MEKVKVEFETSLQHIDKMYGVAKPSVLNKFREMYRYLSNMFPEFSFSINKEATQVMLNHSLDKDYVVINLDKGYMINSVSYYSNEEIYEND